MLETLARLGYASKAVIYAIVGVLAILAVTNRGGAVTDTTGALHVIFARPFGRALLIIMAVGLCGYGAWRVLDAFLNPDRDSLFIRIDGDGSGEGECEHGDEDGDCWSEPMNRGHLDLLWQLHVRDL